MSKLVEYVRENGTRGVRTVIEGESMTQQQFKEDCDVNLIMAKYLRTGSVNHLRLGKQGVYADLVDLPDYQTSLDTVIKAQQSFETIPADIRLRFGNDPGKFISYLQNPENHQEAVKLGLMVEVQQPVDPNQSVVDAINSLKDQKSP